MAANPRSPRARITPPKPVASAQAPWVERPLTSAQAPGFRRWERDRLMQLWQIGVMGGVMLKDGAGVRVVTGLDPENGTTGAFSHPPRGRAVRRTWWRAAVETACKRAVSSGRGFTR